MRNTFIKCALVALTAFCGVEANAQNNVALDQSQNQLNLQLSTGETKYYNTTSISSINIEDGNVSVAVGSATDKYQGNVKTLSFAKATIHNVDGQVEITEAKGWFESAYVKWNLLTGAVSYNVYVKGGQYADWTKIDYQLVRNYGTYGRADVVGLKEGTYDLKVVPVDGTKAEKADAANQVTGLTVKNYDRSGFAHKGYSGIGAYNDDGTLKSNAKVLYVTKQTAKTISTEVAGAQSNPCVGLQNIITAYEKGVDTTPIAFRFIGLVEKGDLDGIGSSSHGIQVKGKNAYSVMNMTFEGIGDDATVRGFGFMTRNATSVEYRNLAVMRCMDDDIELNTKNSHIWIHNMDIFYGEHGSGDHAKGDGCVDIKDDSQYITVSYNRYWDTGKTNMFGMKSESGPNYLSYHHNWFDHSDSRHPRVRTMSVHVWNNYFDNVAKYGVGATSGASVFVENNYFLKTKKPILSSGQGTDALGSGTFSGEEGGMIKAYGNYFDRTAVNFKYYTQNNPTSTGYDAYEVAARTDKVPASEVTRSGSHTYDNFDTDASLMYEYTPDAAEDVPGILKGYWGAGRLNHGDVTYTFKDNVGNDDTDSAYDTALGSLIDNYKTSLVGIFDGENSGGGENPGGGDDPTPGGGDEPVVNPDGTIVCSFAKDGTPSNTFFTVVGNGSDSKGTCTVDGVEYKTCLKMEGSTSVKFTTTATMNLELYFGSTETGNIKIDGIKETSSTNVLSHANLAAGSHELTKADSRNLFYIKLIPVQ